MTTIKRELNSVFVSEGNLAFQQGFTSCRMQAHTLEELDLGECSKDKLCEFYRSRTGYNEKGPSFKEGVDFFIEEMWNDLSSKRVDFTDSQKIDALKVL